jgi:MFS family permease
MGADSSEIGFLFTISAIGPVIGSAIASPIAKRLTYGQAIIGVCWIAALLFPLLAVVPQFYFLGLITGLLSLFYPIFNVVQFSYRVALIPDRLQGRVNSAFRLLAYGFGPAGSALAGLSLGQFGGAPTVLAFGAVQLLLAILVTLNPNVRNARRLDYGALEA